MGVPLAWLMRRQDLLLRVVAGRGGLDRDVVWAHSIELADPAPWLTGGELLLTTGLRLTADPGACEDYVARLVKAGVAAVGFGVGLSHARVPEALVDAAGEAGLPLLPSVAERLARSAHKTSYGSVAGSPEARAAAAGRVERPGPPTEPGQNLFAPGRQPPVYAPSTRPARGGRLPRGPHPSDRPCCALAALPRRRRRPHT